MVREPLLERPIFIAGAGRSGTTLLRSLLSAHSRISVTPETHFMKRAENWGMPQREGPENFKLFWKQYTGSVRFRDQDVDADYCREIIERGGEPTFRSIFTSVLAAFGERVGKPRVGEKTPGHVHFIPDLLDWFPDARILILRRDPRAVVASQMQSPWVNERIGPPSLRQGLMTGSYRHQFAYYADDWKRIYEEVVPASGDEPRMRVISYEDLVRHPESVLRDVCAFLDEGFEPGMLDGRTDESVPAPASTNDLSNDEWKRWRRKHHAKTLEPVDTSSIRKWKEQLTGWEIAMVEGHCAHGMLAAGYEPTAAASRRRAGRAVVEMMVSVERLESGVRTGVDRAWRRTKAVLRPIRNAVRAAT